MWHFFLKDSWVPEFTVMEYLCLLHLLATSSCPSSDIFRIYFLYIWGDYSSFIIFFDWPNLQCNTGQNVNFQATINLLEPVFETFTELKKDPQNKIDQFGASCGRKLGGAARRLWPRVQGLLRGGESKGNLRFQRLWSWVMATGEEERRRRSKMLVRLVAIIMILGSVKGKENSLKNCDTVFQRRFMAFWVQVHQSRKTLSWYFYHHTEVNISSYLAFPKAEIFFFILSKY